MYKVESLYDCMYNEVEEEVEEDRPSQENKSSQDNMTQQGYIAPQIPIINPIISPNYVVGNYQPQNQPFNPNIYQILPNNQSQINQNLLNNQH